MNFNGVSLYVTKRKTKIFVSRNYVREWRYNSASCFQVIAGLDGELDPRQPRNLSVSESYSSKVSYIAGRLKHLSVSYQSMVGDVAVMLLLIIFRVSDSAIYC